MSSTERSAGLATIYRGEPGSMAESTRASASTRRKGHRHQVRDWSTHMDTISKWNALKRKAQLSIEGAA